MVNCKKCGVLGNIILRKKDAYCTECFETNLNHKFRSCIGKNKIISKNENVLICLSGGPCSTVLLDLVYNGITLNNHKKLWITPIFFHLMGLLKEDDKENAEALIKKCNYYKFNIYIGHISQYLLRNNNIQELDTLPEINGTTTAEFNDLLSSMSISSRNDFVAKVCRDLYIHIAKLLQCKYIFTGETLGTLATNLLTNLTLGRGSQVQHDVGFCDNRNEVKIIRPMKDISQEEIYEYMKINHLTPSAITNCQQNSLQAVIKSFVTDLQDNYQATISTVCKTADKIGVGIKKSKMCEICESDVGENDHFSALDATNYSSSVSAGQLHLKSQSENPEHKSFTCSLFPFINQSLCYTCSKMYSEIVSSNKELLLLKK